MPVVNLYSGGQIDFDNMSNSHFTIVDIARGLSNCARYAGQTDDHYSVAQHSVLLAEKLPPKYRLQGLLHDAPEFVLGDPCRDVKQMLPDYKVLETRLHSAICRKFRINPDFPGIIKQYDTIICADETDYFFPQRQICPPTAKRLGVKIEPMQPREAFQMFMDAFTCYRRSLVA